LAAELTLSDLPQERVHIDAGGLESANVD
jgi:hypothetical protein